jgi:hypothetical protein
MTWVLFVIVLEADRYYVSPNGMYETMNDCFEAREFFMATAPKPKINYDAICIQSDKIEGI